MGGFTLPLLLLLLLVIATATTANVIDLNQSNFDKSISGSKGLWLVAFVGKVHFHEQ